jgi:hypothetical protein
MSAFQAYGGSYDYDGRSFTWRCYATARVYEVRMSDHAPLPPAPRGKKWVSRARHNGDADFGWLIDTGTDEFSHILLQVEPQRRTEGRRREAPRHAVA